MATYYVDGAVGNDTTGDGSLGNPWATIGKALAAPSVGIVYVKASATYDPGSGINAGGNAYSTPWQFHGYATTPGDGGRATILASSGVTLLTLSGSGYEFAHFILDGNNVSGALGVSTASGGYGNALVDIVAKNCPNGGIALGGSSSVAIGCEVTNCGGSSGALNISSGGVAIACAVHSNSVKGIGLNGSGARAVDCIVAGNSGIGIESVSYPTDIEGCTVYGNTGDGIKVTTYWVMGQIRRNILVANGGYGLNGVALGGSLSDLACDYNAFRSNTSGARNVVLAGPHDVTLTADPFTNASGGDFSLNNAAGGGALLRAVGFPGALPWGGTGYLDIGALQHQDAGGGSTTTPVGLHIVQTPRRRRRTMGMA